MSLNEQYFLRAKEVIPGGVNSPVRAFKSVGGSPKFIASAKREYLIDVDGKKYLDLIGSWGPMLFGHAHPFIQEKLQEAIQNSFSFGAPSLKEIELAEKIISMVPSIEMVRLVNSGTEATMAAIRLARAYTSKDKIIKFEGCYHGHGDSFLIAAGSGVATLGTPDSPGVTKSTANDTLTGIYNDLESVKKLFEANPNQIAAIILEPVVGNMGLVLPQNGFIEGLRELCNQNNALLIFDEVMTGFRLSKSGYQGLTDVKPDLTTLGKIIGGGLPVGAYGGRKDIMSMIAPSGPVYQAGTLSGNPLATTAGLAMLELIENNPNIYTELAEKGAQLKAGFDKISKDLNIPMFVQSLGSMFTVFFTAQEVNNFTDAKTSDTTLFGQFFHGMLNKGIYLPPSQYESWFLSTVISDEQIQFIIDSAFEVLENFKK